MTLYFERDTEAINFIRLSRCGARDRPKVTFDLAGSRVSSSVRSPVLNQSLTEETASGN